jgi:ATP-binding cassette, subfamily B, bacterial
MAMRHLRTSVVARSLRLVFGAAPRLASLLTAVGLGAAVLNPWVAYTAMRLTEAIVTGSPEVAVRWVIYELLLVSAATVLARIRTDARTLLRGRVELAARLAVIDRAGALALAELDDPGTRDRLDTARVAARARPLEVVDELLTIAQSAASLVVYAVILAAFNGWALLFLLAACPGAAAELWSARAAHRVQQRTARDRRRLAYFDELLFSERLAAENSFFAIGPALLERMRGLGRRLFSQEYAGWRRSVVPVVSGQIVPSLILNGCYLWMALATVHGAMTLGELMLFSLSLNSAQRLCQRLLDSSRTLAGSWRDAKVLFDFLDAAGPPRPPSLDRPAVAERSGLSLAGVGFRYPGSGSWAIRDLDLDIRPGDFVAIIGGNGSGKTTLLRLITGQYAPTEGEVRLDGIALAERPEVKARFAIVFQDFARYGMTLGGNVAVGRVAGAAPGALSEALRLSGADEVAGRLPAGVDTELVPELDHGVDLSGGQWQKVAIARALVREHADFLVLDEPTSALDAESESRLFDQLRRSGKTIILITHRLSSLRATDKVVVLERGRQLAADSQPVSRERRIASTG